MTTVPCLQVLRATTNSLDAEYLVGVRAMFGAMNASGSGSLTLEELKSALGQQGCKVSESVLYVEDVAHTRYNHLASRPGSDLA